MSNPQKRALQGSEPAEGRKKNPDGGSRHDGSHSAIQDSGGTPNPGSAASAATLPSCLECRKRKVKCDRAMPCGNCVRRGTADACKWSWNEGQADPFVLFGATLVDIKAVQHRLALVEACLRAMSPELLSNAASQLSLPTSLSSQKPAQEATGRLEDLLKMVRPSLPPGSAGAAVGGGSEGGHTPPALVAIAPKQEGGNVHFPKRPRLEQTDSHASSPTRVSATFSPHQLSSQRVAERAYKEHSGPGTFTSPSLDGEQDYDAAAESAARSLEGLAARGPRENPGLNGNLNGNVYTKSSTASLINGNGTTDSLAPPQFYFGSAPEFTSALTYINEQLASPADDNAYWGLSLDTQLPTSLNDIVAYRKSAIDRLLVHLPSPAQSAYLAQLFYEKVHWRFHIVHFPAFVAEMDKFQQMLGQGRQAELDPLWLAVFFMIMALGLGSRPTASAPDQSDPFWASDVDELDKLTKVFHFASIKSLQLGDYMGRPRLRTIQAISLLIVFFQQFLQASAGSSSAERILHWLAVSIRSAQMMGIDKLGSNPANMPPDDPAWPPGKNALKRQMALRLWMNLQWGDWMSTSSSLHGYTINPANCTSQLVDNLNDDEISSTDWRIQPHPAHVITSTAFEVFKWHIANVLRLTYDKLVTNSANFSYTTVLELDAEYQRMLDNLALLRDDFDASRVRDRRSIWQRNIALMGVHSRIARLHRPFLSRGYAANSPYAVSKERCISSAQTVVHCHQQVKEITTRGLFWFAYSHTLNAAMVLGLDLFWSIDSDLPIRELVAKRSVMEHIKDIFSLHSQIGNKALRGMVASGHEIICGLLDECGLRQSARASAMFSMRPGDQPYSAEPFASVLRRLYGQRNNSADKHRNQQRSDAGFKPSLNSVQNIGGGTSGRPSAALQFTTGGSSNSDQSVQGLPSLALMHGWPAQQPQLGLSAAPVAESGTAYNDGDVNGHSLNFWSFPAMSGGIEGQIDLSFLDTDLTTTGLSSEEASALYLRQLMGFESSLLQSREGSPS